MNTTERRHTTIKMLAYFHRYLWIACVFAFAFCFGKEYFMLRMGIGFFLYALYSLIGYIFRWKHIYCSYQNAYHQKMTPDHIIWGKVKKSDAYGIPIIFGILGIMMVVCQFIP